MTPEEPVVAWEDFEQTVDWLLSLPPGAIDASDLEGGQ